jgi:RNA polymerase sigma-70 factor (ECF subfamily)
MLTCLKEGNHQAFTDVYDKWKRKVYYYCLKRTQDTEAAKDLTQQSFIKLWKYRRQLDESISLERQLFQKVRQVYLDWLKKEAQRRKYFADSPDTKENSSVYQMNAELRSTLSAALNQLPEKRKKIFELKHIHGYTYKEIAEALGISIKTVDNQLLKAIHELRKSLSSSQFVLIYILFFFE